VVISGAKAAVERAIEGAKAAGAKRAIPLAVSIAAHSPLMRPVQAEFKVAVNAAPIGDAILPVISNVKATPIAAAEELRADITGQLTERVRWTESVRTLGESGIKTYMEVGSGSVLLGLIRRIDPAASGFTLGSPKEFETLAGSAGG
jgi:[acyl-carrier-protein] S-malonyltransferase